MNLFIVVFTNWMVIKMRFETLSEYDDEIKKLNRMIDNWKKYFEEHTEDIGGHTNYVVLEYIRDELKKERDKLAASLYLYHKEKK